MIIAVNSRYINGQPEAGENIMRATLCRLAEKFTEHKFIFIFDRPPSQDLILPANAEPLVTGPATSNVLILHYWLNYKIPALLKKHHVDVFVSVDGNCALRTKKRQCLVVTSLNYLQEKNWLSKFYKKNFPASLEKAKSIVTVSEDLRSILTEKYKTDEAKIDIVKPGISHLFKKLDWEEKEKIKEQYAAGRSYFLFSGAINENSNLIELLKAFTFFKKRQKSNMLLLIAGKAGEPFKKEFKNYRLRNEVRLLENISLPELAAITGAAYALVYPVKTAGIAPAPLQAMQCEVPVVASRENAVEIYGNAALYADPANFNDIAENMMLVYKDEDKARELTTAGTLLLKQYRLDDAADQLMRSILKTFNG